MNGIDIKKIKEKSSGCAYIFTGGTGFSPEYMTDIPAEDDIIIAADSGCRILSDFSEKMHKIDPDIILGDMDSYDKSGIEKKYPEAKFISFPPEKDDTDTALAVKTAAELGCRKIIIAGGLGGRLDHTLANICLLEYIRDIGGSCIITDGKNRAYLAEKENILDGKRKYVSLIPLDEKVKNVKMDYNFKYPYETKILERRSFVTVSNEIIKAPARIYVDEGMALIVEAED